MITDIIIIGKDAHIIKVNFQEVIKPIVKPDIISAIIKIIWENLSPNPISICSNWLWILLENSKELFSSKKLCSWLNISSKYFVFRVFICLIAEYPHRNNIKKLATKVEAPKIVK